MLDMAASAVARTQRAKWAALGLDRGMPEIHDLPELVIRQLSPEEVAEIRDRQLREDAERSSGGAGHEAGDDDIIVDDGIVVEGEDDIGVRGKGDDAARVPPRPMHAGVDPDVLNEEGRIGGHDG
jgi:hypothetical protein